jgi:hypothetical protein
MPFDHKAFLALFAVLTQRAVSKSASSDVGVFYEQIDDAASIKRPKPKVSGEHSNVIAGFDRGARRMGFRQVGLEHTPSAESDDRARVNRMTFAKSNVIVVKRVAIGSTL